MLDFYVHESCQRQGVGKELFEVCGRTVVVVPWWCPTLLERPPHAMGLWRRHSCPHAPKTQILSLDTRSAAMTHIISLDPRFVPEDGSIGLNVLPAATCVPHTERLLLLPRPPTAALMYVY